MLIAEPGIYAEQARQHGWESAVTVGYSITDTFESGASGANATIRARIPLRDRSTELETAQARAAWRRAGDATRVAFVNDIQALCEQVAQVQSLDTLRAFHRDRLTYRREQVDQGLAKPDTLRTETEAVQGAEHHWRREAGKLDVQRLTLEQRYGGADWGRLRTLLEVMMRQSVHSLARIEGQFALCYDSGS